MASSSPMQKTAATGILQSSLSPKYLHTNSTSHTWPFSAIAELIDNAYDPDVKASQLWIDKIRIHGEICLTFTDNGNGMQPEKLHKMLSFGFCEKVADGTHMPVGHYGNGFKSGSMRLGKDALVLTKQNNERSIGFLSQTYLEIVKAETVVVPIATWDGDDDGFDLRPHGIHALKDIVSHSLLRSEEELSHQFDKIPGAHGTRIIISKIRKTTDNKPEFDFATDEYDIRIPDDLNPESENYQRTKRQNHVPECDYSLRAYCAILYLKPKMQIILRQKKVKTLVVEKSLSKTEVDRYKPNNSHPVKVVFGFNSRNKNHYGIMMYHRNRLIKPYERVGHQLKANNLGVGVVGVVQCDFLQPTHNKQDFDYTKTYRACIYSLGVKLNEYWNEKKGTSKSSSQNVVDQPIPVPQEIESLPDQTWVQCDNPECLKWRKLPDGVTDETLPDKWYCYMNPDINYNSCDVPEEKEDESINITAYEKVQKKRLVKEMEEKNRRDKAAKLAEAHEQEEKRKSLAKKEELLKKKEEQLNKQLSQLQDIKPKIKVEGGPLPTAQVAPRTTITTRPISAITPSGKATPRQIASQLVVHLAQSKQARTNQSAQRTPTPAQSLARSKQSTPSPIQASQSTPRSALSSQPSSANSTTNQSQPRNKPTSQLTPTNVSQLIKAPANARVALFQTATPKNLQALKVPTANGLITSGVSYKMVTGANGKMYLVGNKAPQRTAITTHTQSSATMTKSSGLASSAVTTANAKTALGRPPTSQSIVAKPNVTEALTDVKPRVNVSQQTPANTTTAANDKLLRVAVQSAAAKQQNALSTQTVAKTPTNTGVRLSHSLAATAYSEITGDTSTTPQDVKNILASGIKREAPDNLVSPIPAKVQRKKSSDPAVVVIDPLPTKSPQNKQREAEAERRATELERQNKDLKELTQVLETKIRLLEGQVKDLKKEIEVVKSDGKNNMEELVIQMQEKAVQVDKLRDEIEHRRKQMESKTVEVNAKVRELKVLRGNVCKLLQVLVPEIDVESEADGEVIDVLLKQVLDANQ